jgi:type II secretory pathway pseudopilin PulG
MKTIAGTRTCRRAARHGHTLLELLVALPLAALLGAIAVGLLLNAHHLARRLDATTEQSRELRQAGEILTSELRSLSAADLISWSDTAIEFHALVASGFLCATHATNALDLLPLDHTDALRTAWFATPQPDDDVWTLATDSALFVTSARWQRSGLATTAASTTSSCIGTPLYAGGGFATFPQRITLQTAFTSTPETGTLVRITRRARYSLYRASDGLWYLGRKSFDHTGWTTIQPVAGPLRAAARDGLRIAVIDSAGNTFPVGAPRTPHAIALALHTEARWLRTPTVPGVVDSLLLTIALRGEPQGNTP